MSIGHIKKTSGSYGRPKPKHPRKFSLASRPGQRPKRGLKARKKKP